MVESTPLKNMKVSWDDHSQYTGMVKNVPNHQSDIHQRIGHGVSILGLRDVEGRIYRIAGEERPKLLWLYRYDVLLNQFWELKKKTCISKFDDSIVV